MKSLSTAKLKDIRHKGYYEAHGELVKAELDVPSLLNVAQDHYRTLRDHKQWPATRDSKDLKGLNRGYGSVNMTVKGDLNNPTDVPNHVYQLVRAAQNWDKSKRYLQQLWQERTLVQRLPYKEVTKPIQS